MGLKLCPFDKKFGAAFITSVPLCPGVYEAIDAEGTVVYVGKAKILRRRLQQYRNAKRCRKHYKMRAVITAAVSIRITTCATDRDALLLENKMIQELRPKFNVVGAFSFLYPVVCLHSEDSRFVMAYTSNPEAFAHLKQYGAFRSRRRTRDAFFAIATLFEQIGHREPPRTLKGFPRIRYSYVAAFRQVPTDLIEPLHNFFKGSSHAFLEKAILALLEKPSALRRAEEIQEAIDELIKFYKFDVLPLRKAMQATGFTGDCVAQTERDRMFISSKPLKGPS